MKNITIDYAKKTIAITKSFEKKARVYGSDEYMELREARNEFPNFRLVVKASKSGNNTFKGFDYDFMEQYINKHDDEAKSIKAEFDELKKNHLSYPEMKKWFVSKYPAFDGCKSRTSWLLTA